MNRYLSLKILAMLFTGLFFQGAAAHNISDAQSHVLVPKSGGSVYFKIPQGMKALSEETIKKKWPNARRPAFAVGSKSTGASIAFDIKENYVPESQLHLAMPQFVTLFRRLLNQPTWLKKEVREFHGRKWIYFELITNAFDTKIRNLMMMTPIIVGKKKGLLMFNFNSTEKEYPAWERALQDSIQSIHFHTNKKTKEKK